MGSIRSISAGSIAIGGDELLLKEELTHETSERKLVWNKAATNLLERTTTPNVEFVRRRNMRPCFIPDKEKGSNSPSFVKASF